MTTEDDWDELTEDEKRRRTNLNAWDSGYRAGLADGSLMSQNTDPFPTPRGALSPDGVTAAVLKGAVPEPQEPTTAEFALREAIRDLFCRYGKHDIEDRLNGLVDAALAEARAAAPPDIEPQGPTTEEWHKRGHTSAEHEAYGVGYREARAAAPPDIDVERLAMAMGNLDEGPDGDQTWTWTGTIDEMAEAFAAEYRRLASPDATRREPSGE